MAAASSSMASNLPVAKKIDVMLQFNLVAKLTNVTTCNARVPVATIQTGIVSIYIVRPTMEVETLTACTSVSMNVMILFPSC